MIGSMDFSSPWLDELLEDPDNKAEWDRVMRQIPWPKGHFELDDNRKLHWVNE